MFTDLKLKILNDESSHFDIDLSSEGVASFAQRVLLTLNTWKSEFSYDSEKGIDYPTILKENFSPRYLEAFFLFSLKSQLPDFDTMDNFEAEHDKVNARVKISFIAYSTTGEETTINQFQI
jgi:hypothetical protein